MKKGKVVLGIMAGAAFGAVLGILFAPAKGSCTRKKILQKRDELIDKTEEKFDEFMDGLAQKIEAMGGEASDLVKKGKERIDEAKEAMSGN